MLPNSRLPAPVNVTLPTGVPLALKVPLASNVPVEIDKVPDEFTYVVPVTVVVVAAISNVALLRITSSLLTLMFPEAVFTPELLKVRFE